MKHGRWRWVLVVALFGMGCSERTAPPNVIILLMDTLRPDRMGCYGYERDTSPAIDALAAQGTVFNQAYATSDYTPASTGSLFTGLYPLAHGYVNADYVLDRSNLTMAEIFQANGYHTSGFTANALVGGKYHMDQGFAEFTEVNRALAEDMGAWIEAFLRRSHRQPFLLYAHFMDVHDPYRIPREHWERFGDSRQFAYDMQDSLLHEQFVMDAWWGTVQKWWPSEEREAEVRRYFADYELLYDASIAYWDQVVAGLLTVLDEQGMADNTMILIVSDHGEQLLEHGFFGHGNSGYEVGIRIPFIFYDPLTEQLPPRVEQPVSLVDVLPTLLKRLDIDIPPDIQGRQLWSLLSDTAAEGVSPRPVYTEGTFFANRPFSTLIQTYRDGRWKLILDRFRETKELYDLEQDPAEQHDRFDAEPEIVARLADGLRALYHENLSVFNSQRRASMRLEEERLRELQALGYLAGSERTSRMRTQFYPMRPLQLEKFGPFGDEEELAAFRDTLDFTRGQVVWGQVLRGYSDVVGRQDVSGVWFDRRSTFLLPNRAAHGRVVMEVDAIADADGNHPTVLELETNNAVVHRFLVTESGSHRLEAGITLDSAKQGFVHLGLRADNRFVLQAGESPRTHLYGSLKIRRLWLEE